MKILVLYHSRSGNTRKLADAFVQGVFTVDGAEPLLKSTTEVTEEDFLASEAVIAGSPVYFGTMAAELKKVFDDFISTRRKMEGKPGAAFATSADASGGKETTIISIIQAMLIYGMIIVGDPMDATGHYGTSCAGAPDEKTLENARRHGKHVAEITRKLRGQ
ncbi:flavodoxin family protein [candidate division WOR-3 bacterium]|uniref:Flavodoxin family protein n=1 Tax=candidate division WOR-3 bacterium TaxID=2052148 RepID=A0A9D5K896_UNCW3|nr:flavodoxin family protein [candidate division WOR-3 bacterium]MBD3363604.1 flavodoxin family protein [candidate division WOR-3 bacterium]